MSDVVVFSGNAHPEFARRICDRLGVKLSGVDISRFSNDCLQAQLLANCRQRDVYIIQPLVPPTQEHLMELLLMIDAARGASAASITAVMPHYAYAWSDKKDASRISIGGRLVADLLVTAFAACVLKNVERFSTTLPFAYRAARVTVQAERQDSPPRFTRFTYRLELVTDEPPRRLALLQRNIEKFGTVSGTLGLAAEVVGELVAVEAIHV